MFPYQTGDRQHLLLFNISWNKLSVWMVKILFPVCQIEESWNSSIMTENIPLSLLPPLLYFVSSRSIQTWGSWTAWIRAFRTMAQPPPAPTTTTTHRTMWQPRHPTPSPAPPSMPFLPHRPSHPTQIMRGPTPLMCLSSSLVQQSLPPGR